MDAEPDAIKSEAKKDDALSSLGPLRLPVLRMLRFTWLAAFETLRAVTP